MKCLIRTVWVITGILMMIQARAQSPHGKDFQVSCDKCHTADNWTTMRDTLHFNHDATQFPLEGQHQVIDCRQCHISPEFSKAETNCASCHLDVHEQSVGMECSRCHDPGSWLVNNIQELHRQAAFPLVGAHASANCIDCHKSETGLRFVPIGNECVSCHMADYAATTSPDHKAAGFSTNCTECHRMDGFSWDAGDIIHDFFPLTKGHDIQDCARCHTGADYSKTSPDCLSCHEQDFISTSNPNHQLAGITTDCITCHTTDPGWSPAEFRQHDAQFFPIYSGEHQGEWSRCTDCHTNPGDFGEFSCITCHTNPETNDDHSQVFGYSYSNTACLACHPTGDAEGAFDHNNTNFPLTGAHTTVECISCHANGFTGTPTACFACHQPDFEGTLNPNHTQLSLSTDCASCHTTNPEWNPAGFPDHNNYYALNGAHAVIANQCATCHQGDYTNTPSTCVGCHLTDYNQTTNPPHAASQFSTDCISCHTENAWQPASFDHDAQYFPIYTGSHAGVWTQCIECHTTPGTFTEFTCTTCHTPVETEDQHEGVAGYDYNTSSCIACHPNGEAEGAFDHNATAFPLTGAHTTVECISCHANGYAGTPTACDACHTDDFNQTINPNHLALGLPTDCASCHTTTPGWEPASFAIHDQYYPLNGAHALISNQCATCHQGDYNATPNTCAGCHLDDYTATTDPPHINLQFSQDCASCHNENAWEPSTFDHDAQHFPIYSGAHGGVWNDCVDCHTTPGNYSIYTCTNCHTNPETDDEHSGVNGYVYNSSACLGCHPTGDGDVIFDHNASAFPLTGSHIGVNCIECHAAGYAGTPTACEACHTLDHNQSINPNHVTLGIPMDCASCHTTVPDWNPAAFPIHNQYYVLEGAHALIANDCATCHNGDYNNTPNTCNGCHMDNYNATTNPNHITAGYSTECENCHNQNAWQPASFDHNLTDFPLTGAHATVNCLECHANGYAGTPTECNACHQVDYATSINPNHPALGIPTDCISCHTTVPDWNPAAFPIHNQYYVLEGAHAIIANDCATCHNGDYNNTPNTCYGCHADDYSATTNPNHITSGYSTDCATCHNQNAWQPANFDHNATDFPLTGAHTTVNCIECHANGYAGTPTECNACHQDDYNTSSNPNHTVLGIPTDCISCHTTVPDWNPAAFPIHNQYYVLEGAHALIANDCATCHNGDYNNTPNTCYGCHADDYNNTSNPNHITAGYSTECAVCHNQTAWQPSIFDHNATDFPLTGAHTTVNCIECHANGYAGTPTECNACHTTDYNQSTNPNHVALAIPTDCASCHTTVPDWNPATFPIHNQYYVLEGAHAAIANQCATCHNGDYNNTPNTCVGCHLSEYNQTDNPPHQSLGFSTDCASCHTQSAWSPAEYTEHDNAYFPIYSGDHEGVWDACSECHTNPNNYSIYTCISCHTNPETNQQHAGVNGYIYQNEACLACHPTGDAQNAFDHNASAFPLTGAHLSVNCIECHANGYAGTPTECNACHTPEYNQASNPSHTSLSLPMDCVMCHTTAPDWNPALFPLHNNYYPLVGAHAAIANQCVTCHNGNYNNTPNTCVGCHLAEYNQTNDPDHQAAQFPTNCDECHSQNNWVPSTWDHDNQYFPIFSGKHDDEWNQCTDCHTNPNNYSIFTCLTCHTQAETNADHDEVSGYQYNSNACYACHPEGED